LLYEQWSTPMNLKTIALLSIVLSPLPLVCGGANVSARTGADNLTLNQIVKRFELRNESFVEGIARLTQLSNDLHLGLEEIPRSKISDPPDVSIRFSLKLENKTVQHILDTLCKLDRRYTWSQDESTVNIYPRSTIEDSTYFLNRRIKSVTLKDIPDAYEALTPLSKLVPGQQVGYMSVGGNRGYASPWTVTFNEITVRQFINRITEHVGPKSSWTYQGSKQERFFAFFDSGLKSRTEIPGK
jgi:hypothetical protein